ncbi:MAG: DNA translocase FtsK 4TM domain-containing protein [Pelobacteraceae bacterium]
MSAEDAKKEKMTKELQGMALGTVGVFILLAFLTFNTADVSWNSYSNEGGIHNLGGRLGAQISDLFFISFGLASYLIPLALLYMAYTLFRFKEIRLRSYKLVAAFGLLFSLATLFAFFRDKTELFGQQVATGGAVGVIVSRALKSTVGVTGALLLLLPLLAASIMILSKFSFILFAGWWLENFKHKWAAWQERRSRDKEVKQKEKAKNEGVPIVAAGPVIKPLTPPPPRPNLIKKEKDKKKEDAKTAAVQETFEFIKAEGDFHTPPFSLLDVPPATEKTLDRDALTMNARLLEKKLKDYNIDGEVVEICPGPVITMYEFSPAPGIKISRIAGLTDDLTMALQAMSIRIVAPIPGKGVVGIEVPNRDRDMVFLREIFNCEHFSHSKMKLPLALGKDIAGLPVVTDLAKAPHLLVAGSTGSGKSVSINTMILSLLYTSTPKDVRMIMVDPKMLEFSMYEGIPHLLLPVVTEPKKASLALKWAVNEMERRYQLLSDKGVRNIESYNKKLAGELLEQEEASVSDEEIIEELEEIIEDGEASADPDPIPFVVDDDVILEHSHLPYIVVIVDELADLMMVAGREVEEHIARLAQKARASGIHLILATQRPSVDVITGLIKANLPSRISFQVTSKVDSRTILDTNGAESLLGNGDMLYMPPGTSRLQRIHGAFVSDAEVQRVVDFLKKQGKPVYEKSILEMKDTDEKGSSDDEVQDERWEDALRLVAETKQASISMVQRRLRIGYNRAARIVEMMEHEGMIAQSDGTSKPREIYMDIINAYLNSQLTR